MKLFLVPLALAFAISPIRADSASTQRDHALEKLNACLKTPDRPCRGQNQNIEILIKVYRGGDKSVLPLLVQFTPLTDFYGEALVSSPEDFLAALAQLPEKNQRYVTEDIAGGTFGLRDKARYTAIRDALQKIPDSSPVAAIARRCTKALERSNASFLINYFPPFSRPSAELPARWYADDMYALGEEPLWSLKNDAPPVYRLTYLGAFSGPEVFTLTMQAGQVSRIDAKALDRDREVIKFDDSVNLPPEKLTEFFSALDQTHFWTMPVESSQRGKDGAEWIMEAMQNGNYHVVVRWCPATLGFSAQEAGFADAGRLLFELAGHKKTGAC